MSDTPVTVDFYGDLVLVESDDGPAVAFLAAVGGVPCTCLASALALRGLAIAGGEGERDLREVFLQHRALFEAAANRLLQHLPGPTSDVVVIAGHDLTMIDGECHTQI